MSFITENVFFNKFHWEWEQFLNLLGLGFEDILLMGMGFCNQLRWKMGCPPGLSKEQRPYGSGNSELQFGCSVMILGSLVSC